MASGQNQTRLHANNIQDSHNVSFPSIVCWFSGAVLVTPNGKWPAPDQIACQKHPRQSLSVLPKHCVLVSGAVLVTPYGKWPEPDQTACQKHLRQSSSVLPKHSVLVSGAVLVTPDGKWPEPDCCCMPKASETVIICPSQALCAGFRCRVGHARWQVARTRPDCMPSASETFIICPSQALCAGVQVQSWSRPMACGQHQTRLHAKRI